MTDADIRQTFLHINILGGGLWTWNIFGSPSSLVEKVHVFFRSVILVAPSQLDKKNTFIQAVIENFASLSIKRTHMIVITTDEDQTALAKKQCLSRGILSQNIVQIDPNLGYAGAMIYATQCIYLLDKDAVVISTPSDQYLSANEDFRDTIKAAYLGG